MRRLIASNNGILLRSMATMMPRRCLITGKAPGIHPLGQMVNSPSFARWSRGGGGGAGVVLGAAARGGAAAPVLGDAGLAGGEAHEEGTLPSHQTPRGKTAHGARPPPDRAA